MCWRERLTSQTQRSSSVAAREAMALSQQFERYRQWVLDNFVQVKMAEDYASMSSTLLMVRFVSGIRLHLSCGVTAATAPMFCPDSPHSFLS